MRRIKGFLRRYWLALLIVAVFAALVAGLWANRYSRLAFQTAYFVTDTFVDLPPNPYEWAIGEPRQEKVTFPLPDGGPGEADLYSPPGGGRHGAALVVIGAAPRALEDPRAVRLARGVARTGVVVMFPRLDELLNDRLKPPEIEEIALAFRHLRGLEQVDPQRTGIISFSVGAGLALVAATEPGLRDAVDFVASFGGYYDLFDLIASVTTGTYKDGGRLQPWEPAERSIQVLRRSLISYIQEPPEQEFLTSVFTEGQAADPATVAGLSPLARSVYELLANTDPRRVDDLFAAAPAEALAILRRLSPSASIQDLRAPVYIVHDRDDRFIPYVESRRLATSLPPGQTTSYLELDIFRHVTPRLPTNPLAFLVDLLKFFFQVYRLGLRLT